MGIYNEDEMPKYSTFRTLYLFGKGIGVYNSLIHAGILLV